MPAFLPASDPRSEQLLWDYAVLENGADDGVARVNADLEVRFAGIVKLARILCLTPASYVSFVGDDTQWLSAREGLNLRSTPRLHSFCAYAMTSAEPLVVADARADPRFADNPLVIGEPFIRFYAGAPLCSPEGVALGALCVVSPEARAGLSDEQHFGLTTLAAQIMAQLDAQRAARHSVAANENRFRVLADTMPQMAWSAKPDGHHDYFNARWYQFTGVPEGSTDGEGWNELFHPDDQARTFDVWHRSLATGEPYEIEYRLRHSSGHYRWTLGRALPVRNEGGEILRWFGTCTDIDDVRRMSEERELVAQELSHRIKNTFLVISGLVGFSVRSHPEAREFAADMRERIAALGRAHNFLRPHSIQSQPGAPTTLHGVLGELFVPYRFGEEGRLEIFGADVAVDERGATPIALLMHELGTNAVKYGALSNPEGTVRLLTSLDGDTVRMAWTERGGPPLPDDVPPDGFGVRISKLSVETQLGGKLTRHWERDGLRVEMAIPRSSLDRGEGSAFQARGRTGMDGGQPH